MNELVMKSYDNQEIRVGDCFVYQFDTKFECKGIVKRIGYGKDTVVWDDGITIPVKDFYYEPTDKKMLKKL